MSTTRSIVFATLVLTIAVGATAAAAQQEVAERLVGPESFPELELTEERAIDFVDGADESGGGSGDIQGWMRMWRDPETDSGLVAMAAAMDTESSEAFLAGFQSTVVPEDRADHPLYPNVVTLETVNPLDEPTLAAIFSDGSAVFILITEGDNREALLDRAIAAQLAMIETPLLEQSADLAEEVGSEVTGAATGEFIARMGLVVGLILLVTWAARRTLKKRFDAE